MDSRSAPRMTAALGAVLAAVLWALYYLLILSLTPGTSTGAILLYPFLIGGVAYSLMAFRDGHGATWVSLWTDRWAWARILLVVAMQASVVAVTFLDGPVDAALLSLVGDVVATPLLATLLFREHRGLWTEGAFVGGVLLCVVGGSLAVVGGSALLSPRGLGLLVAPAVPLAVALYFLVTARANRRAAPVAVVAHTMVGGAVLVGAATLLWPGGLPGLRAVTPTDLALLAVTGLTTFWIAPYLYFRAIQRVGLVLPALLMVGIPIVTLALTAGVLHRFPPVLALIGVPVAIVGAALAVAVEQGPARAGAPPEPSGP
ncbi:MAG: DMT family transporter [Thermoplasmata archaeon]